MDGETAFVSARRARKRVHPGWEPIAALAARQHGTVARWQLIDTGWSSSAVTRLIHDGYLHPVHRGVYAVGHPKLSVRGHRMAAVLFGGPGTVLSHRPAGAEWGLRGWSGRQAITLPTWRRGAGGIEVHSARLPSDEIAVLDGIPITTVPRTVLDLATLLDTDALLRAVNVAAAGGERYADALSWPALLERHRGERGTARLRRVLGDAGFAMGVTDGDLEELFGRFLRDRGLPAPRVNATIDVSGVIYRPDCLWPAQRLIVELKSVRWHASAGAVSSDSKRDRRLLLAGYRVIHVTWAQLMNRREADELERDLRVALALTR